MEDIRPDHSINAYNIAVSWEEYFIGLMRPKNTYFNSFRKLKKNPGFRTNVHVDIAIVLADSVYPGGKSINLPGLSTIILLDKNLKLYIICHKIIIWDTFKASMAVKKGCEICHNRGGAKIFCWLLYRRMHSICSERRFHSTFSYIYEDNENIAAYSWIVSALLISRFLPNKINERYYVFNFQVILLIYTMLCYSILSLVVSIVSTIRFLSDNKSNKEVIESWASKKAILLYLFPWH